MFKSYDNVNLETTKAFAGKILRKLRKLYIGRDFKQKHSWTMDVHAIWESTSHFIVPYYCYTVNLHGYKLFLKISKKSFTGTLYGYDRYGNKHIFMVDVFPAMFSSDAKWLFTMLRVVPKTEMEYGNKQLVFNFKETLKGGDVG